MKRFGAYEILHELSQGGMGSVLLARRKGPGTFEQLVAIKTIRTEYASAAAVRATESVYSMYSTNNQSNPSGS